MKPLIISLGHRFRSDDAVGPRVLDKLHNNLQHRVDCMENPGDMAKLIEAWSCKGCVYLIDAFYADNIPAGAIRRLDGLTTNLPTDISISSSHALNLNEAIELSRMMRLLPEKLVIYAISGKDFSPGESLCSAVATAAERVVDNITADLGL